MSDFKISVPDDDPSFTLTRSFAAPRTLIWDCYTMPEHMKHFWGPHGSTNPVMEIDLKVGGVWRVVMRFEGGDEHAYASVYLEIGAPDMLVYRDAPYDWQGGLEGLPPLQLHSTISIAEKAGRSTVKVTVRTTSVEFRDEQIKHGFAQMVEVGHDRLETYLKTLQQPENSRSQT